MSPTPSCGVVPGVEVTTCVGVGPGVAEGDAGPQETTINKSKATSTAALFFQAMPLIFIR
jgi:hypothetical protein